MMMTHLNTSKQKHDHLDASNRDHSTQQRQMTQEAPCNKKGWIEAHFKLRRDVESSKFFLFISPIIVYGHCTILTNFF